MELYRLLIIYNSIDVKSLEHLFWWWNCQGINCGSRGFYFLRIQNPDVFAVFFLNFVSHPQNVETTFNFHLLHPQLVLCT